MVQILHRKLTTIDRRNERMIYLVVSADSDAERIPVYNQLLRNASPKFKRLIDSMSQEDTVLEILGISNKTMSILIEYIYQTFQDAEACLPITDVNIHELAFAANKFELTDVQSLCHDYLNNVEIKEDNCIQLFVQTPESTNANFKRKCLEIVLSSLGQLITTESFVNLTFMQLVFVIHEGRTTGKCSDDVLCEAAINWIKYRSRERSLRVKELIVEFPCKDHRRLIIQALFQIPNPELQKFAFDLMSDLYTDENKTLTTTPLLGIDADTDKNKDVSTSEACKDSHQHDNNNNNSNTSSLKRPLVSSLPNQEIASCSEPKKNKTQSSVDADGVNLSLRPSLSSNLSENSSISCCDSDSPVNGAGCTSYFLTPNENSYQLLSFNLHNFEVKPLTLTVPPALASLRHLSVQHYQGRIYFLGGRSRDSLSTNDVHIFNMEKKSWTVKKMLDSRHGFQSVRFNSLLFVLGGLHRDKGSQSWPWIHSMEVYNLNATHKEHSEWEQVTVAKPVRSRMNCGLVVFNKRVYSIGGLSPPQAGRAWEVSGVCEILDPKLPDNWKLLKAELSFPRHAFCTVATANEIYAIGGRTLAPGRMSTVEILRANSDVWEVGPNLIKPRTYACGGYCKKQNAIFVFGGDCRKNPTAEKLDLNTMTWSLIGNNNLSYENYYSDVFRSCD